MIDKEQGQLVKKWGDFTAPLVSVICPTFNQAEFIGEALDSFLLQETRFPIEIIVHDDASTDGTTDIVARYRKRYPQIVTHVIQKENQYSLGRRVLELAMPYANGKYVAICEGDDFWTDTLKLQKQVDFLENNSDYVITYHRSQPFNIDGDLDVDYGGAVRDLSALELRMAHPLFTLTTCFRNVVKTFPPEFSTARLGDLFLWSLLGKYGKGKFISDIGPGRYRVHQGGVFSSNNRQKVATMTLVTHAALLSYYARIGDEEIANYFKSQIFKYSAISLGPFTAVKTVLGELDNKFKKTIMKKKFSF